MTLNGQDPAPLAQQPQAARLLVDEELVDFVTVQERIRLSGNPTDWYSLDSPVQPSSVDLHVGEIFVTGRRSRSMARWFQKPSEPVARSSYILKSGYTAIVTTREQLDLPSDVAAISFAPNHIAMNGLLLINTGHIDPGYRGKLRYTLINMGREDFPLQSGHGIATLLFFKLHRPVKADYETRGGKPGGTPTSEQIDKLAKDFVDLEQQIVRVSDRAATKAVRSASAWAVFIAAISIVVGWVGSVVIDKVMQLRAVQSELIQVRADLQNLQSTVAAQPAYKAVTRDSAPSGGSADAPATPKNLSPKKVSR